MGELKDASATSRALAARLRSAEAWRTRAGARDRESRFETLLVDETVGVHVEVVLRSQTRPDGMTDGGPIARAQRVITSSSLCKQKSRDNPGIRFVHKLGTNYTGWSVMGSAAVSISSLAPLRPQRHRLHSTLL